MLLLVIIAVLMILDVVAYYFGVESRDGFEPSPTRR
jgi:hypothetical protein